MKFDMDISLILVEMTEHAKELENIITEQENLMQVQQNTEVSNLANCQ